MNMHNAETCQCEICKEARIGYPMKKELEEKKQDCDANHVNIDDLLSEFNRRGFNTENWDGDCEAPEAIVSGVKNHYSELEEKLEEKETLIKDYRGQLEKWLEVDIRLPSSVLKIAEFHLTTQSLLNKSK